jgi:hypothetical protein
MKAEKVTFVKIENNLFSLSYVNGTLWPTIKALERATPAT